MGSRKIYVEGVREVALRVSEHTTLTGSGPAVQSSLFPQVDEDAEDADCHNEADDQFDGVPTHESPPVTESAGLTASLSKHATQESRWPM